MAKACTFETKLHGVMNHKTIPDFIMYHVCCAHIASLVRQACFAVQSDACLTRVVGLLLIMRLNVRNGV